MSKTAHRTDPKLWDKVKSEITKGRKGGETGQWSARKAQLAVQEYKKRGGGYIGRKSADNSLARWTDEANREANAHKVNDRPTVRSSNRRSASERLDRKKDEPLHQARHIDIEGRSNMLKAELEESIRLAKH
jgi:hypothetical protein